MINASSIKKHNNVKKHIMFISGLLLSIIIETSLNLVSIYGLTPLILLCILVYISMYENLTTASLYGLFSGLIYDVATDNFVGLSCITFTIMCIIISLATLHYIKSSIICFSIFVLLFTLIYQIILLSYRYSSLGFENFMYLFLHNGLLSIMCTVLVSPIIFYLYNLFTKRTN